MRDYAVNAFESINAGVSRHLEKSVVSYVVSNLTLGNTIERLVSTWESLSEEEQAVLNLLMEAGKSTTPASAVSPPEDPPSSAPVPLGAQDAASLPSFALRHTHAVGCVW